LIVSRKLSGDSTDDEVNNDFTMGSEELQAFRHEKNIGIPMKNAHDRRNMVP
jgi:hypothetical protein